MLKNNLLSFATESLGAIGQFIKLFVIASGRTAAIAQSERNVLWRSYLLPSAGKNLPGLKNACPTNKLNKSATI